MKIKISIVFILLIRFTVCAQDHDSYSSKDSLNIENQIAQEATQLKNELNKSDKFPGDYWKKLGIEFTVDTFKIEKRMRLRIDKDYSDPGMLNATYQAVHEYDKLLHMYFQKILEKLDTNDQETLLEAQQNWQRFRESEKRLNILLADDKYSGGGTIQRLFIASRNLELIKNRVLELYHYLNRIVVDE